MDQVGYMPFYWVIHFVSFSLFFPVFDVGSCFQTTDFLFIILVIYLSFFIGNKSFH